MCQSAGHRRVGAVNTASGLFVENAPAFQPATWSLSRLWPSCYRREKRRRKNQLLPNLESRQAPSASSSDHNKQLGHHSDQSWLPPPVWKNLQASCSEEAKGIKALGVTRLFLKYYYKWQLVTILTCQGLKFFGSAQVFLTNGPSPALQLLISCKA